ncbi:protein-glutamate methylesterase/protein-glutamine glutaminase [Paraferrimonas sedimenticola]|uniref:Protein-glutamate methylesterase/protein-glutamine glutaminase n=1 Tax=Paraferrimonas sedimenticola TaxID=375674 RepID=A0AA37RTF3_9GAMM|nr:chemotaxis response regulator protein-glutamate methylesterase [Paraferrimonas sedimenticola]GLP94954.1 chemotaxis response regulator protein-glutamate methylesterase [Paraferrimonas sedimenticola]
MKVKVLVVDDSGFFRRRVSEILTQDPMIQVIGQAENGREGVRLAKELKPDVITMDLEMPVMNGIEAVGAIMASNPTPILMFSSLTHEGARATLNALNAGAADYIAKTFEEITKDDSHSVTLLRKRVRELARQSRPRSLKSTTSDNKSSETKTAKPNGELKVHESEIRVPRRRACSLQAIAIGSSTGGPVALQTLLSALPAGFPAPIFIAQHMPAAFTPAFAERLDSNCAVKVKHASDGDLVENGVAYLAPGGQQMMLEASGAGYRVRVLEGRADLTYKPSVDVLFASIAKVYGARSLSLVLTGMGADGREGARLLKQAGGSIWAQDEESCVVYGMPQAVVSEGLAEAVLPIEQFAGALMGEVRGG